MNKDLTLKQHHIIAERIANSSLISFMDTHFIGNNNHQLCEKIVCKDGLTLSVQAGAHNYCRPRQNAPTASYAYYTHFEVGFPSKRVELLMSYAEDKDDPTQTVYGRVPRELIEQVIAEHGGINDQQVNI
jgi:hypothetical protein